MQGCSSDPPGAPNNVEQAVVIWGVHIAIVDRFPSSGAASLEVRVDAGTEGGIGYLAGFQDWRPFDALTFDIHNSGDPFRITLLVIDDSYSAFSAERYAGRFKVTTGWNEIRVPIEKIRSGPKERSLNVGAVFRMLWTVEASPRSDLEFNLDHIRLIFKDPIMAGQPAIEITVVYISTDFLGSDQPTVEIGIIDHGSVGARTHRDFEACLRKECAGGLFKASLGQTDH